MIIIASRRRCLVCCRKKGSWPPPPKFVHLLCGMELRRRCLVLLMLRFSLALSLDSSTIRNTSSSSSRPLSFCTCTSKHFRSWDGSSGTPLSSFDRSTFYLPLLCTSWFVCGTSRASNVRSIYQQAGSSFPLAAIEKVSRLAFAHFYSFF